MAETRTEYTMEEIEEMLPKYKETSSGPTSALQLVDTSSDVKFINDSSDASDIPRNC